MFNCTLTYVCKLLHLSKVNSSNSWSIKKKKLYVHLLLSFSAEEWNPSICHSSILSPSLSSTATPKHQKESFWCCVEKSSLEKKWFWPAQPFVFPLNKASDKASAWCTSIMCAWARSRAHKQSHVSRQTECSLQPSRHPDENIMFYSKELLQVNTWFAPACCGASAGAPETGDTSGGWWSDMGLRMQRKGKAVSQCQSWGISRDTSPWVLEIIFRLCTFTCVYVR